MHNLNMYSYGLNYVSLNSYVEVLTTAWLYMDLQEEEEKYLLSHNHVRTSPKPSVCCDN